jgi:membrane protein DedA with SNARE-associated domain
VEFFTNYMNHYGYFVLLSALMLELLAFPLPGEVIMSYAGLLVFQGKLNWALSILMAGTGSCIGMTLSYWIGFKLGTPFFVKHGHRIHMGPERLKKTSEWFERYGNKVLVIAYFIPGIRHITGYFSGVTRIPFRTYMLYAYSGAFIWVSTFISLGKILGPKWERFHHTITKFS